MTRILIFMFFLHWVADFVLQSRRVAEEKSKHPDALFEHVGIYSLTLFAGLVWIDLLLALQLSMTNGVCHWIIDYISSKMTTHFYTYKKMHEFWITVGFDQFLHSAILITSVKFYYLGNYVL